MFIDIPWCSPSLEFVYADVYFGKRDEHLQPLDKTKYVRKQGYHRVPRPT